MAGAAQEATEILCLMNMVTKEELEDDEEYEGLKHYSTVCGLWLALYMYTSVKIIKNEVGCRDDTVPKTVETRRHCEED